MSRSAVLKPNLGDITDGVSMQRAGGTKIQSSANSVEIEVEV